MPGTTICMTAKKQMHLGHIHQKLHSIHEVEDVSKSENTVNGVTIWTLVFEKYYVRSDGYASAVVVLTEYEQEQTASIVVSGASGRALNLTLGSTRNFAKEFLKVLEECGFTLVESDLKKGSLLARIFE